MTVRKTAIKSASFAVASVLAGLLVLSATPGLARGPGGGMSGTHINGQGSLNTNGPNSLDRDFGRDRAADRIDVHAVTNGHANNPPFFNVNSHPNAHAIAHRWRHGRHHHYGWR